MPALTADALSKSFGTRTLFENVSFSAETGEKIGFIGPNGSGKSTLFLILAGLESSATGRIAVQRGLRTGYLSQEPEFEPGRSILDTVAAGNAERESAIREYEEVAAALERANGDTARLVARQSAVMEQIESLGGWGSGHEIEAILTRLGLADWERDVHALSGGEKKRVALARVLVDRPDILLLDEPTNHLDADTTLWLEDHLIEYPGAVLLITHDRYFLDRVVTRMIEVGVSEFASYVGGYTEYLEQKAERVAREQTEGAKRDRLLEQELAWVKRSPAARTGKQKARIKRLDNLQDSRDREASPSAGAQIRFGEPPRLGRTVLEIDGLNKSLRGKRLIGDFSTLFKAGERIGIIGANGAGKTTLLRILTGEIEPDSGIFKLGKNTRIAYFDQKRMDLDPGLSVYESIATEEWVTVGDRRIHSRSYLESFLFPTSTHEQRVGSLSGGERNRLLLARLLLNDANLLLLDEPTNDLDLDTLRTLEAALIEFGGSALVVTHDRFFLDKVATGLLVFEGDGTVHRHEGGYDLYRRLRAESVAAAEPKRTRPPAGSRPKPAAKTPRTPKLTYREKVELDGMDKAIMEAEARREELGRRLSDPALYAETPEKVGPLRAELEEAESQVASLYARWEELEGIASASGAAS